MKKIFKSEQSGRSMVEMLGVLAIIGVLSVGGIAGYSKAMAKFKMTKAMDQLTMLLANIRTTYAGMQNYNGLTETTARTYQIAPQDMFATATPGSTGGATGGSSGSGSASSGLVNAFGGNVLIAAVTRNGVADMGFAVAFNALTKEACINLATSDWGTGIDGMTVSATAVASIAANSTPTTAFANLPMNLATANTNCSSDSATNSITWYFY